MVQLSTNYIYVYIVGICIQNEPIKAGNACVGYPLSRSPNIAVNTFELFRGYRDLWIGIMSIQHKFPAQLKLGKTIFLLTKI